MSFAIHPRLLKGAVHLVSISQCHVLLKNESTIPWLQIVPEVADGVEDLHQLTPRRFEEVTGGPNLKSLGVRNLNEAIGNFCRGW